MNKSILSCIFAACTILIPLPAMANSLPHRQNVLEKIADQKLILDGKFVVVTYEDDYFNPDGQQIFTSKRQAVLPTTNGNIDTTDVLVQTISGKLATVLVPSASLEASFKIMTHSANIVRILDVAGCSIENTRYISYGGFHFTLGNDEFDTPWSADDARVIRQMNDAKSKSAFADVAPDRWSAGAIYLLTSDQIVSGVGSGQFSPSAPVSRAAFLQMLAGTAKKAGFDLTKKKDLASDISSASWAKDAASEIKAYLDSQEPGAFDAILQSQSSLKPNQGVSRAEAAQIMAFFVNGSGDDKLDFSDWNGGVERARVASLVEVGGITGVGSGEFEPNGTLTREQMASIAARLLYAN